MTKQQTYDSETMPKAIRKLFLLHAQKPIFKKRVDVALQTIEKFLEKTENPYISVSGGKDSSVLLSLCRRVRPCLDAIYLEMHATYPQSNELLDTYENLTRIVVADRLTQLGKVGMRGKKGKMSDDLARCQKADPSLLSKYDGHFYGLRADESVARRRLYLSRGDIFFRKSDAFWVCQPIATFRYEDVWAYIVSEGINYNTLYNLMWDRPKHAQRVASFTLTREANMGTVASLKAQHPELFNILISKTSEFKEYI